MGPQDEELGSFELQSNRFLMQSIMYQIDEKCAQHVVYIA
jgi:hypothetical protein